MTLSGEIFICTAGETWDGVALAIYGQEKYACEILAANPELSTIPIFSGGETLKLPVVIVPDEEADYQSAKAPWKE